MHPVAALLLAAAALAGAQSTNYCQAGMPRLQPYPSGWKIEQVSLITRHGARAPANVLPTEDITWLCDATDDVELLNPPVPELGLLQRKTLISQLNGFVDQIWNGNCTIGQLTWLGANQHFQMGQILSSIYIEQLQLLGEFYSAEEVYIRSIDDWRVQQSAEANMLGLYSFAKRRGLVPSVNIMPSSIETMDTSACPLAYELIAQQMQTAAWASAQAKMAPLYERLNGVCGTGTLAAWNGSQGIDHFFDALSSRSCQGIALPCNGGTCLDSSDLQAVQAEGDWEFNYLRSAPGYAQASVGAFLAELIAFMQQAVDMGGYKYLFFSADDDTVGAILAGFNVSDGFWPPFAANLIFELWTDGQNNPYVRALYNGQVAPLACATQDPVGFCPWARFLSVAQPLLLTNYAPCLVTRANPAHAFRRHLAAE